LVKEGGEVDVAAAAAAMVYRINTNLWSFSFFVLRYVCQLLGNAMGKGAQVVNVDTQAIKFHGGWDLLRRCKAPTKGPLAASATSAWCRVTPMVMVDAPALCVLKITGGM
jgi:hypothetical protein